MSAKEFAGHSSEMRADSPWLASEDLMGKGDVECVIASVFFHKGAEFDEGRKEDVFTVSFEGKKKQLVLNSTNRRSIVAKYGPNTQDWRGKKIVLYCKTGIKCYGETRTGIRIR